MTEAYVTLATTDAYGVGALVLAHSLLSQGTTRQLVVLITPSVSDSVKSALANVFNSVVTVDVLDSQDSAHLALLERPELGVTFTKLHCWTLTQFTKCVFLDADILALQNSDELFSQPELSAACDVGWPDCFNSGMFVFVPSKDTFDRLLDFAKTTGSFDGGDQGLLNSFFPSWNRLSFVYNMVASAAYTYLPAFKQFGKGVKLVHFLGSTKPWHGETASTSSAGASYASFVQAWWAIYRQLVQPTLPVEKEPPAPPHPPQQHQQSPPQAPVAYQPEESKGFTYHWSESDQRQSTHGQIEVIVASDVPPPPRQPSPPPPPPPPPSPPALEHTHSDRPAWESSVGYEPSPPPSHQEVYVPLPQTLVTTPAPELPAQLIQLKPAADSRVSYDKSPTPIEKPATKVHSPATEVKVPSVVRKVSSPNSKKEVLVSKPSVPETTPSNPYVRTYYSATGQPVSRFKPLARPSVDKGGGGGRAAKPDSGRSLSAVYRSRSLPPSEAVAPGASTLKAKGRSAGREGELAQHLSTLCLGENLAEGRQRWEAGRPDYMGRDSFDNILAYIESKVKK